jgi:hypothetical protein
MNIFRRDLFTHMSSISYSPIIPCVCVCVCVCDPADVWERGQCGCVYKGRWDKFSLRDQCSLWLISCDRILARPMCCMRLIDDFERLGICVNVSRIEMHVLYFIFLSLVLLSEQQTYHWCVLMHVVQWGCECLICVMCWLWCNVMWMLWFD